MGLFGRIMDAARVAAADARREAERAADERPPIPDELDDHYRRECVRVGGTYEHQDAIAALGERPVVRIRKARKTVAGREYDVRDAGGTTLGYLSANDFMRSGAKTRGETVAEVRMPVWNGDSAVALYVPISDEAKERRRLDTWISVPSSRWTGPSERVDEIGGEILESRKGSGKPSYVITAGGMRLCEVTSRMKCHEKVSRLVGNPVRRIVAEPNEGEHGTYWRVGLYF